MAVYTTLALDEIRTGLAPFELGRVTRAEAVAAGIENTTYFVTFEQDMAQATEYVLTLGESIAEGDMQFVAQLTTLLHRHGLPVPAPATTNAGEQVIHLANKPALLIPKIAGKPPSTPSIAQCYALGNTLARLHEVTQQQSITHTSHKSLGWIATTGRAVLPHLPGDAQQLLHSSLTRLDAFVSTHKSLPRAIIHGDLFRDNTLFDGENIAAVIDFFSAGTGYLLFDLAVAANDWCAIAEQLDAEKVGALLAGYCAIRPLSVDERQAWGEMLAIAALRFYVSRLADRLIPSSNRAAQVTKDPEPYKKLLVRHRTHRQQLDPGNE